MQHQALWELSRHEFQDAYSVQLLQPAACQCLREEAESFRAWAARVGRVSPGLLLSSRWYFKQMDGRYDALFDRLLVEVLRPLDAALYKQVAQLAYHHDYCINFEEGVDVALKPHTDDSDLTVNIFLGAGTGKTSHRGADLLLLAPTEEDTRCGTPRLDAGYTGTSSRYTHNEVGRGILHPGERWHAVEPLHTGSRWNLLVWALRDDREWKSTFFADMERHLLQKAAAI